MWTNKTWPRWEEGRVGWWTVGPARRHTAVFSFSLDMDIKKKKTQLLDAEMQVEWLTKVHLKKRAAQSKAYMLKYQELDF